MPLDASDEGEDFSIHVDERGILLDEFGAPKKIPAATFKSCPIYYCGEQMPGTSKYYVVALAHDGSLHPLFTSKAIASPQKMVYDMRNRSAAGDLSEFPDVVCDI